MSIASSTYHTLMLDAEGNIWACGKNDDEQLGFNTQTQPVLIPQKVLKLTDICSIGCGRYHSACVDKAGILFMFGQNSKQQFTSDMYRRVIIRNTHITSVHCGPFHTIVIDSENRVYALGRNEYGCLGIGGSSSFPKQIESLVNVHYVACGAYHTLFLTLSGDLYACGNNTRGQLGLGCTKDRSIPEKITNLTECVSIACGCYFSIVLTSNGDVYSFGDNVSGQLGIGTDRESGETSITLPKQAAVDLESPIFAISCGNYHSAFLETGGRLWVCGENTSGQLGLPQLENIKRLTAYPHSNLVYSVACGASHMIVKSEEGVLVHGNNKYGQLGIGNNIGDNVSGSLENPDIVGFYSTSRPIRAKSARK